MGKAPLAVRPMLQKSLGEAIPGPWLANIKPATLAKAPRWCGSCHIPGISKGGSSFAEV